MMTGGLAVPSQTVFGSILGTDSRRCLAGAGLGCRLVLLSQPLPNDAKQGEFARSCCEFLLQCWEFQDVLMFGHTSGTYTNSPNERNPFIPFIEHLCSRALLGFASSEWFCRKPKWRNISQQWGYQQRRRHVNQQSVNLHGRCFFWTFNVTSMWRQRLKGLKKSGGDAWAPQEANLNAGW